MDLLSYNKTADIDNNKTEPKWKDKQDNIYENVCTITGIAIPALFEYYIKGEITIVKELKTKIMEKIMLFNYKLLGYNREDLIKDYTTDYKSIIKMDLIFDSKIQKIIECIKKLDTKCTSKLQTEIKIILLLNQFLEAFNYYDSGEMKIIAQLVEDKKNTNNQSNINVYKKCITTILKLSNLYNCIQSGYYHPLKQIKYYNWLNIKITKIIIKRLITHISKNAIFEYRLFANNVLNGIATKNELQNYGLCGMIDCYDVNNKILWEFKCVKEFNTDHFIQLALYAYLLYKYTITTKNRINDNLIQEGDTIYYLDNCNLKKGKIQKVLSGGQTYKLIEVKNIIFYNQIIYNESNNNFINCTTCVKYNEGIKFNLFNLFTGEIQTLVFNYENLKKIVGILIEHKVSSDSKSSDEEFMKKINLCKKDTWE